MNRPPERVIQSVRQRLLEISRQRNEDFQFVLMRYAHERMLYRLAQSSFTDRFVLKGALLFNAWMNQPYRPTKDMDLLGFRNASPERMRAIFTDIRSLDVETDHPLSSHQTYGLPFMQDQRHS
jgi:predicted nucleotidyltransferase component of viral defense system